MTWHDYLLDWIGKQVGFYGPDGSIEDCIKGELITIEEDFFVIKGKLKRNYYDCEWSGDFRISLNHILYIYKEQDEESKEERLIIIGDTFMYQLPESPTKWVVKPSYSELD